MSETSALLIACIKTYHMILIITSFTQKLQRAQNTSYCSSLDVLDLNRSVWCEYINTESDNPQSHITTADTCSKQDLFLTGFESDRLPLHFIRHKTKFTRLTLLDRAMH
jgi:hypothetical protein